MGKDHLYGDDSYINPNDYYIHKGLILRSTPMNYYIYKEMGKDHLYGDDSYINPNDYYIYKEMVILYHLLVYIIIFRGGIVGSVVTLPHAKFLPRGVWAHAPPRKIIDRVGY